MRDGEETECYADVKGHSVLLHAIESDSQDEYHDGQNDVDYGYRIESHC